jgi:hypothetical protein
MAVADLVYTIAGDSSKFVRALQQADKQLERTTAGMSRFGKVAATVSAGFAAAGTAVLELARRSANDMAEIQRAAEGAGVSAESLSKLGYAASTVGLQLDDMRDAAFEVSLKLGEAARGEKPATEAFTNVGVAVRDANGALRDSGVVMDEAIQKLAEIKNPAERAAAAAALLGDDVALKMAPLLARGSEEIARLGDEAVKLGVAFDDNAGKSAVKFQENMRRLEGVLTGVGRDLVEVFTPALTMMSNAMLENAAESDNMASRQEAATEAMRGMLIVARSLQYAIERLSLAMAQFAADFVQELEFARDYANQFKDSVAYSLNPKNWGFTSTGPEDLDQRYNALWERREQQNTQFELDLIKLRNDFRDDIDAIMKASATTGLEASKQSGLPAGRWDKFMEQRQKFLAENQALGINFDSIESRESAKKAGRNAGKGLAQGVKDAKPEAEKAGREIGLAVIGGAFRVIEENRTATASAVEEAMAAVAKANEAAAQKMEQLRAEGERVTQSTLSGAELVAAEHQRLKGLLDVGAISADTYALAMRALAGDVVISDTERLQAELDKINELLRLSAISADDYQKALANLFPSKTVEDTKTKLTDMQQLTVDAAKSLSSSFSEFLFDPFNASLGDMVKNFALSLAKMVTDLLAKKAVLALLGAFGAPTEVIAATGFADGGLVSGPGTGTSDSIPARLSNGEYVMPADTVRHYGRDFMDALRAMRPQREAPVARFAEGGYVDGQGGGSGGGVRVVNVVDSSMVQDFLTSSAGEQVILNTIRRNRRQVSQVMA